ncbi:MAG: four helix bundle protein [Bacteroidota bacterium]
MGKHNYKELRVWQRAMDLCKAVYSVVADFPAEEKFGLSSQIKRCAVSIPSNIAEGAGRNTDKTFNYFLGIAYGSSCELGTQLDLAKHFEMLSDNQLSELETQISEIQKMIYRLSENLKTTS